MTNHQLIYTSCRRGIDGVNDGQQVFSYNAGFPRELIPRLTPSMTYKGPDLPEGVAMSEALVPDYPQSFIYERVVGGIHHLALRTYLGKDYMGPSGRFGNFLSHDVLLGDLTANPMEFYGSSMFRSGMPFEEVNSAEPPGHLPAPRLTAGAEVSHETVRAFLDQGDRWRSFTRMAACLLAGDDKDRRLLIRDTPDSVVQWISALLYCLPRTCVGDVSLSTYEYDPMSGERRIVGVVGEGTAYNPDVSSRHPGSPYIFDLSESLQPELELPEDFTDFIEAGLLIAPESLDVFHRFVEQSFPQYVTADESLFGVYAVYQQSRGEMSTTALSIATEFLSQYGTNAQQRDFLKSVLGRPDCVSLVTDPVTGPILLQFLSTVARGVEDLLNLTFHAEGYLLDQRDHQAALELLWTSFFEKVLSSYPDQLTIGYRGLMDDRRLTEARSLFELALSQRQKTEAKLLFDEVISQLDSPSDFPSFIESYYAHSVRPEDREHQLRFIIDNGVSFDSAGDLVEAALAQLEFGRLPRERVSFVRTVWRWATSSGVDLQKCPRLWFLHCGDALTTAKDETEFKTNLEQLLATSAARGLVCSTEDPAFLRWVVPHLFARPIGGKALHRTMASLGMRPTASLGDLLCELSIPRFELNSWLKAAECVYSFENDRLLGQFGDACKKLSNRDIMQIERGMPRRYAKHPPFMRSWETVYAATQTTSGRLVKAWIGQRRGKT